MCDTIDKKDAYEKESGSFLLNNSTNSTEKDFNNNTIEKDRR
jgi:hypothetical protein